jgi:hypothetical protein
MIIQLDPKLTSKSNSQNRGRFVLEDPELVTAKSHRRDGRNFLYDPFGINLIIH